MRQTSYEDAQGRKWRVALPDQLPDSEASVGLHIGPPSLEPLGLPEEIEIRLHNQLFARGIITLADAQRKKRDIFGALQATFKVDIMRIFQLYKEVRPDDASQQKVVAKQKERKRR